MPCERSFSKSRASCVHRERGIQNLTPPLLSLSLPNQFNIATNQWSAPFQYIVNPTSGPLNAPYLFTVAGQAVIIDEEAISVAYTVDTSSPGSFWKPVTILSTPLNRVYQRFLSWGSTLYFFGGYSLQTYTQNQDLWAVDIQSVLQGSSPAWASVSPAVDPASGVILGYPDARVGYTWTSFEVGATLFGGISNDVVGGCPANTDCLSACFQPNAPPTCRFHHHVRTCWCHVYGFANERPARMRPAHTLPLLSLSRRCGASSPATAPPRPCPVRRGLSWRMSA